MKKLCTLLIALLLFFSAPAATQIADATNYITITVDGVVKWTLPKRGTAIEINGNTMKLRYDGVYVVEFVFSDVTSPSTADIEALRVAIKNMLINV